MSALTRVLQEAALAVIYESHQEEMELGHRGDDHCLTCDLMAAITEDLKLAGPHVASPFIDLPRVKLYTSP